MISELYKQIKAHPYCEELIYEGGNKFLVRFGFTVGCFSGVSTNKDYRQTKTQSLQCILNKLNWYQDYEKGKTK